MAPRVQSSESTVPALSHDSKLSYVTAHGPPTTVVVTRGTCPHGPAVVTRDIEFCNGGRTVCCYGKLQHNPVGLVLSHEYCMGQPTAQAMSSAAAAAVEATE